MFVPTGTEDPVFTGGNPHSWPTYRSSDRHRHLLELLFSPLPPVGAAAAAAGRNTRIWLTTPATRLRPRPVRRPTACLHLPVPVSVSGCHQLACRLRRHGHHLIITIGGGGSGREAGTISGGVGDQRGCYVWADAVVGSGCSTDRTTGQGGWFLVAAAAGTCRSGAATAAPAPATSATLASATSATLASATLASATLASAVSANLAPAAAATTASSASHPGCDEGMEAAHPCRGCTSSWWFRPCRR